MVLDLATFDLMIAVAERMRADLAVGLVLRWLDASRWIKARLEAGNLGPVSWADTSNGTVFAWQVVSDATSCRYVGGEVAADIGTHVLDVLLWCMGDPQRFAYRDDAMGCVEAECAIHIHRGRAHLLGAHAPQASPATRPEALLDAQLSDFVGAACEGPEPHVCGPEGRRPIELLDNCRRLREPRVLRWLQPARAPLSKGSPA